MAFDCLSLDRDQIVRGKKLKKNGVSDIFFVFLRGPAVLKIMYLCHSEGAGENIASSFIQLADHLASRELRVCGETLNIRRNP